MRRVIISTVVLVFLAGIFFWWYPSALYQQQLLRWSQQVEQSSQRLTVILRTNDRIALDQEFKFIVALQQEINTTDTPQTYIESRDALLFSLHFYQQALYSFKNNNFAAGKTWLDLSSNAYKHFADTMK